MENKVETKDVKVTMGWDGNPITTVNGFILSRKAEMILNARFYPTGTVGEWPCDPETGEKLEQWTN